MDVLVPIALQELAVEGSEGCTLTKLWSLIQNAAAEANIDLAGRPKQFLWQELLKIPGMVMSLAKSLTISASDPRVQPVESAEKLGVHLVAPETLRDSSLGLYDLKVCDARLSKEQRDILERIAKSRTKGITQSQLSKEFKVAGNKIFYLVKMLEVRGLVVRQTTLVRTGESKTPIVATNLLHLTRYAKDLTLSSHQRFEILKKSKEDGIEAGDSVGEDGEGDDVRAKARDGDYVIKDDFPAMEEICQKLEETEGKVLVVGDLKGSLGYRKAAGHRNWRRLIKRLQDAGVVEVFSAQIDRKVRPCARLLKSFDVKALSGVNEEIESENTLKRDRITEMVMELSIDQQIYHLVDQSGSDGVQMMEVFNRLGLQNKRNYCRVATMLARQCLVSEAENHKRSTLYRLKTVDNANDAAAQSLAPVPVDVIIHASPELPARAQTSGSTKEDAHVLQAEKSTSSLPKTMTEIKQLGTKSRSNRKKPESAQDVSGRKGRDKKAKELLSLNKDVLASEKESGASNPALDVARNQSFTSSPNVHVPPARTTQHHSGIQVSTTTRAQREQRILEKLQAEKFVLRVELHRWLEELENRKDTMMDRKTLSRILQAFQRGGLCKCVLLSMPGLTNCGRQRTVEVVLLPSITVDEEVLNKVHEKVRKFDMDCRGHGQSRVKKKDEVPVLEGVKRMPSNIPKKQHKATKFDPVNDGTCSMQANGFIPAKMVRVSMLHHFLWSYAHSLSHESEVLGGSETPDGMVGSCRIFALANAIQRMPLELFLQIIGSIHKVENTAKWCKQGLRLCDLPKEAFSLFLDTNATGRLSWLVDVLRRLKLVRLVMGCRAGVQNDQQEIMSSSLAAVLTYAMESEPYLEEPAPSPLPSFGFDSYDTSPRARHEFSIATKDGLDAYWQTLEYFYSGAQPALARHAFPGSSVPELFGLRSWTSLRIMSTEQRSELLKRVGAGGIDNRKSAQECAQIAKDLNLSLEQVLGVSYEKNRICRLQTLAKAGQGQVSRKRTMISGNFAEPSHVKAYKKQRQSELLVRVDEKMESRKEKPQPAVDEDGPLHQEEEEDDEDEDEDVEGNRNDFSFVANLKPSRQRSRRFIWSERLDRLLITAYVKQRAQLGAGYPRVDWNTMEQLPAPPSACRRRMGQFRQDLVVRKALLSLCSLLAARYVKHSESRRAQAGATTDCTTSSAAFVSDALPGGQMDVGEDMQPKNQVVVYGQLEAENIGHDYSWDNMSEPFCAAALDEIIRCKNVAKASASKRSASSGARNMKGARLEAVQELEYDAEQLFDATFGPNTVDSSVHSVSDLSRGHPAFATSRAVSSLAHLPWPPDSSRLNARECSVGDEVTTHFGGTAPVRFIAAAGPTRRNRKSMPKILRKPSFVSELTTEQQVRKSVGVANAIEIVKLVLLNSINEKELVGPLVDAVQRFKEAEVFTAVKYLREEGLLMAGQGAQTFVLSPKFFHDCSASRFPFGTGDQWRTTAQWLKEHSENMEEDWVSLPSQQQAGQLAHLLSVVSRGEFAFNPSVPAKDIGEVEEKTTRRHASQRPSLIQGEDGRDEIPKASLSVSASWARERRERGFPGVEVSLIRSSRSIPDILSKYGSASTESHRLLLESIPVDHDSQVYSAEALEQTGATNPVDDTHAPGMYGGKDSITCPADSGDALRQDCGNMLLLTLPDHDKPDWVDTQDEEFADPSVASSPSEDVSRMTPHRIEQNSVMGSIGDDTVIEECDTDDSVALAQSTVDVGDGCRTENSYRRTLSTTRAEVRDVLETCGVQIPDETGKNSTADRLEDMVSSDGIERLPTCLPERETERSDRSVVAVGDNSTPAERHSVWGHRNTGGSTRTWALEKCVLSFSDRKPDVGIECARHMNSELLRAAYRAIERAGEEGLTLEMLQAYLQSSGFDMGEDTPNAADYVQALESFSLVKRVNAFDHVRILEISQSKRFHLNIIPNNNVTRKRRFSSLADTVDTVERQPKSFSSTAIECAGGSDGSSRRKIDQPYGSAAGSSRAGEHRVISLRSSDGDDEDLDNSLELVSVVPWLNRRGALHASMLKSLTRRVMGIVALHPGTAEDTLIEQLNVLNPQSARQLLQLLEADGHLFSRPIVQPKAEPPRLLRKLLKEKVSSKDSRYVNHYFSNPMSGGLL